MLTSTITEQSTITVRQKDSDKLVGYWSWNTGRAWEWSHEPNQKLSYSDMGYIVDVLEGVLDAKN